MADPTFEDYQEYRKWLAERTATDSSDPNPETEGTSEDSDTPEVPTPPENADATSDPEPPKEKPKPKPVAPAPKKKTEQTPPASKPDDSSDSQTSERVSSYGNSRWFDRKGKG